MQLLLFNAFNGLIQGVFYALMALGLALILSLNSVILRCERSEPRRMIGRSGAAGAQAAPHRPSPFEGRASRGRLRVTGLAFHCSQSLTLQAW